MGTQGGGNPDTLFLERQSSQEKHALQTVPVSVRNVNFCFPFSNGLALVSGGTRERMRRVGPGTYRHSSIHFFSSNW